MTGPELFVITEFDCINLFPTYFLGCLGDRVKLGYNELGYNEHSIISNKKYLLVSLRHFINEQNPVIRNNFMTNKLLKNTFKTCFLIEN